MYSWELARVGSRASPGSGGSVVADSFAWAISDNATQNTGADRSLVLATGVPSGAVYYASPDLLPGQTLEESGGVLSLVGDSTVPTVDSASADPAIAAIAERDIVIEVMDSPLARARNLRYPLVWWGQGESGAIDGLTGGRSRLSNVLSTSAATYPCISGDTIEISPGAVAESPVISATSGQSSCYLPVRCSVTIKNIDGRGRWQLLPDGVDRLEGTAYDAVSGIAVSSPSQAHLLERIDLTVQGCVMMNYGKGAHAIRMHNDSVAVDPGWHKSIARVTLQDFKCGMPTGLYSYSVLGGGAEELNILDGLLLNGGDDGGQEHTAYVSARTMLWRGVLVRRDTRPNDAHMLKLTHNYCTIEGCVFDSTLGDTSYVIQNKGGGNLVVRGSLFINGQYASNGRGTIGYVREQPGVNDGGWSFGLSGHTLLVEKNLFISHASTALGAVYFAPEPPAFGSGEWMDPALIASVVIRDNIAMSTSTEANLIRNQPTALISGDWTDNNNTVLTYDADEPYWTSDEKLLKLYRATGGTIAATGSVATKRFVWPQGTIDRTDAYRGLA